MQKLPANMMTAGIVCPSDHLPVFHPLWLSGQALACFCVIFASTTATFLAWWKHKAA